MSARTTEPLAEVDLDEVERFATLLEDAGHDIEAVFLASEVARESMRRALQRAEMSVVEMVWTPSPTAATFPITFARNAVAEMRGTMRRRPGSSFEKRDFGAVVAKRRGKAKAARRARKRGR